MEFRGASGGMIHLLDGQPPDNRDISTDRIHDQRFGRPIDDYTPATVPNVHHVNQRVFSRHKKLEGRRFCKNAVANIGMNGTRLDQIYINAQQVAKVREQSA